MLFLQRFQTCAFTSPVSLAIASEGRQLSYGELNRMADQIADGLREAGVAQGCLVGILLDRSPEMIAGLLGIWKAGGAYVHLDPAAPVERMGLMLTDAAPPIVLTRRKFFGTVLKRPGTIPCLLDMDELCARSGNPCNRESPDSADSLAYVIYTSGSTGMPKGAKITHGALANTLEGVGQDLQLGAKDIVLAWSTVAFDAACLEIFLPLAVGASLYLVEKDLSTEGGPKRQHLHQSSATVVFGTPTMYRILLEEGWQGDPRMQVVVGGEALPLSLGKFLAATCRTVWNQYGPTETAICATRARISADAQEMTIGHPLPNVSVRSSRSTASTGRPKGSIGEMYIGGAGVGLGYLNRHELHQAHFLPDPAAGNAHGLVYKSGDLAVERADGSFDFCGRVDGQVKVRGFRIELGEIETALRQCDGVQAVVVRAIEFEAGDLRLIAFVLGATTLVSQWKQSLDRRLPHYMVPSEWVPLQRFPLTAGGKVDVKALDAMRLGATAIRPSPVAPAGDPVETRLKEIWEKLLKRTAVGSHDNFFALGGHSLLATRLLAQVEQQFGFPLPHSVLAEYPTIHGLATYLHQGAVATWPQLVTLRAGAFLPPLFIAHGIGGSLLSFMELAAALGPERPVYGLQLPAFINEHEAKLSFLAANYLRQMRAVQPCGPYCLAGHSSGGLIVFEIACQLVEQGESVGLLALLDCDPNAGKHVHQPFRNWNSFQAAFRRAWAEVTASEFGMKERLERMVVYRRIKIMTWLAARSRRLGHARRWLLGVEGYLAPAIRNYELRIYPGSATLFVARDEPGSDAQPANAWAGKILGGCDICLLPGTHRSILYQPHVTTLAKELTERLAQGAMAHQPTVVA